MKLITLNIWGGHVRNPLLEFIQFHRETDIFCLQEVYHNATQKISDDERFVSLDIFAELHALLPEHQLFFRPVVNQVYGVGMLIKKDIPVLEEGEITIYDNPAYPGMGPMHSRNLQWVRCQMNTQVHTIMNVHGLWNGKGKTDAPERIVQSQRIREFVDAVQTPHVLCGDFNLRPDTESMRILQRGMNNLIQDFNISSTRTRLYPKEEKFADYILTSPEITVNHFEVLKDEVSDHSPLLLDFG
jgi:endonuclease/exonuclease/phosphatase family metal-dependent hydrolase